MISTHGLLTTVAYQFGKDAETVYALEGSVAIAGAAIRCETLFLSSSFSALEQNYNNLFQLCAGGCGTI